jgi:hypothetical protein
VRSATAALVALRRSNVPFRREWKPQELQAWLGRLQTWQGPFTDPDQRLPQTPGVAARRRAAQRLGESGEDAPARRQSATMPQALKSPHRRVRRRTRRSGRQHSGEGQERRRARDAAQCRFSPRKASAGYDHGVLRVALRNRGIADRRATASYNLSCIALLRVMLR